MLDGEAVIGGEDGIPVFDRLRYGRQVKGALRCASAKESPERVPRLQGHEETSRGETADIKNHELRNPKRGLRRGRGCGLRRRFQ